MKYTKLITCTLLLLTCIGFVACKKKNNSNPLGNSLLLYVNYKSNGGDAIYYRMVYGVGSNVDSIIITGGGSDTNNNNFLAFNYVNSSYNIIDKSNNKIATVDINTSIQIDSILTSSAKPIYIFYNGSQVSSVNQLVTTTTYPFSATNTLDYTYNNGNITSINTTGLSTTYDYDMSKSGQLGDGQRITQFLTYGRAYTTSANLVTEKYVNGTWQEQYSYLLDGSGRITQMTRVTNNTSIGGINDTATFGYVYNY